VARRLLKPRIAFPMSFALGLLVLWELGALPVPLDADAGPIARAAIAVGLAVLGSLVGFVAQWVVARVWGGSAQGGGGGGS
jgi:hypothetical protein